MDAKAILFTGPGQVVVETVQIPEPGPGEMLVANRFSCVSPGTEMRTLNGTQPGQADWPFIPGYAVAGEVMTVGEGVEMRPGARVRCGGTMEANVGRTWGGHVSYLLVREDDVQVVPDDVKMEDAAMAKLAAIAYRGVQLAQPLPHQTVMIIGLGPIGQMSTRLFAMTGARVIAVDLAANRAEIAGKAGVETLVPETPQKLTQTVRQYLPQGADVVVDATGSPAVLKLSPLFLRGLDWTDRPGPSPRFIVQGSYPDEVTIDYRHFFTSEVPVFFPRDARPSDYAHVLEFLSRGTLDLTGIVSETAPPEKAPELYARFNNRDPDLMTALFAW